MTSGAFTAGVVVLLLSLAAVVGPLVGLSPWWVTLLVALGLVGVVARIMVRPVALTRWGQLRVLTVFTAPRIGKLADRFGRVRVLTVLVAVASVVTLVIANGGPMPMWVVLVIAAFFFVFASGRFVPGQAIMTLAVPPARRGAFMSLSGCARDVASGSASITGGLIVTADASGRLIGYHWLGWLAVGVSLLALALSRLVRESDQTMPVKAVADS